MPLRRRRAKGAGRVGPGGWRRRRVVLTLLAALALVPPIAPAFEPLPACRDDRLHILVPDGPPVAFDLELARTPAEQARGLMFRPSLAPRAGMLFVFDPPRPASFWMRNTMIPLDMIFIDAGGVIESVAARTTPYSERTWESRGPVRAVLEVAGGVAAEIGASPGTPVRHPAFAGTGAAACP